MFYATYITYFLLLSPLNAHTTCTIVFAVAKENKLIKSAV
jgi:hypothetical protein